MKRIVNLICAVAPIAAGILAVSCSKEEAGAEAPAISANGASVVIVPAAGGQYAVSYTVSNPVDGGKVECSGDASWLSDFDTSVSGTISFTVAQNRSGTLRSGNLTVLYRYSGKYVSKMFGVSQDPETGGPVLEVQGEAVTADCGGGTYSFTFRVVNPEIDGDLTCTSDVGWVSEFDYSQYGTVSFTVDANGSTELRTGEITASYSYSGGKASATVAVVQDHFAASEGYSTDFSGIVGTYEASGYVCGESGTVAAKTWILKIYEYSDTKVLIDGLSPSASGQYPETCGYAAWAVLNSAGQIVIPPQFTGYMTTFSDLDYYLGWIPCIEFNEDYVGWYYSTNPSNGTLTYDPASGTWSSDYGWYYGLFAAYGSFAMTVFVEAVAPGFTIKRVSESTSSAPTTPTARFAQTFHTDFTSVD